MHRLIGRRTFLRAAATSLIVVRTGRGFETSTGFTHGVASGHPSADSVVLWTRFQSRSDHTQLAVEVSDSDSFAHLVARESVGALADRDHTARITLRGLKAGSRYYFRFQAPDGRKSPIGRTGTLPTGSPENFRIAVFSCANLPFGWFHAYAHAAAREDLDLAVHLGDYIYEYAPGVYPSSEHAIRERVLDPAHAARSLADYRARYANYRTDPDLLALHARLPMIPVWDDHEFANDAWSGGAENHDPAHEGIWAVRRDAAQRAWREWMPVPDDWTPWAAATVGDLVTLLRLETRITGRTEQLTARYSALRDVSDRQSALLAFRDTVWSQSTRRMLGAQQEAWLLQKLIESTRATRWQVLVQTVPMGRLQLPDEAVRWSQNWTGRELEHIQFLDAARRAGLPISMDNWNGYVAQRERILEAARVAGGNLIVLSGDSHNAWAYELQSRGGPAAVEASVQAVASPGWESWFAQVAPAEVASASVKSNPELVWADTSRRGYLDIDLRNSGAKVTWQFSTDGQRRDGGAAESFALNIKPSLHRFEDRPNA